eukprot:184456_1
MSQSNTEKPNLSAKSFADLIPYKSKPKSKIEAAHSNYPFWNQDENTNYRDHVSIAIFIGTISLFSTLTQLLFVIYAPTPYKWISLAFLILGQISSFFCYIPSLALFWEQSNMNFQLCLIIGCCSFSLVPLCPIALPILHHVGNDDVDWKPLITTTATSIAISMFQAYPQIIILTIMITASDDTLILCTNSIITWSFIACVLSIIALSIQIASVFEQSAVFVVNSIWLLFDCVLALCVVSGILYDHVTLTIFYIDITLYSIWILMWIIIILILFVVPFCADIICSVHDNINFEISVDSVLEALCMCICGIMCLPFMGAFCGCLSGMGIGIIGLVSLFVIPILMYFHLFTIIWFFIMDYFYGWNLCPMSLRLIRYEHDGWDRYVLFDWIKNGESTEERNDRLYSINMVILDYDIELKRKYQNLCDDMFTNIRNSTRSSQQSVHQMTSAIDQFFVLRFENEELNLIAMGMGKLSFLMKWTMIYFPINRIIHCIIPFIIIFYIGWSVQWNMNEISLFLKVLYGSLVILFIICSICIGIGWKSLYYHRLILPINKRSWTNDMNWNTFVTYTANCHYYIISLKIVVDWCESKGGDKYIGYIIMNLCGVTQPESELDIFQQDRQLHSRDKQNVALLRYT